MAGRKVTLPDEVPQLDKVPVADLVKGREYVLTGDFWPHGGSLVKLHKRVPAKATWPGTRGDAVIVRDDDKSEFILHPRAFLFVRKPVDVKAVLTRELAREDLGIYTVVQLAARDVTAGDIQGALARLKVDADKIRMHSPELYALIQR